MWGKVGKSGCNGLSRRRQGFKSPWGRQMIPIGYAPVAFKLPGSVYRDCVPALLMTRSGEPFFVSAKVSAFAGLLPSITASTFCSLSAVPSACALLFLFPTWRRPASLPIRWGTVLWLRLFRRSSPPPAIAHPPLLGIVLASSISLMRFSKNRRRPGATHTPPYNSGYFVIVRRSTPKSSAT